MCKDSKCTCRTIVLLNLLFGNVPLPSPSWFAKIGTGGGGRLHLKEESLLSGSGSTSFVPDCR